MEHASAASVVKLLEMFRQVMILFYSRIQKLMMLVQVEKGESQKKVMILFSRIKEGESQGKNVTLEL
jgi:hypothetical protein